MLRFVNIERSCPNRETCDPILNKSATNSPIVVFTDGACVGNGKAAAKGAYAVVWPEHPHLDQAHPLPPKDHHKHTNNRAELSAVILAIELADKELDAEREKTLVVYTDSMLTINSMTEWMPKWKRTGWKKLTDGKPVANVDLLRKLDELMRGRNVVFRHVKAHTKGTSYEAVNNDKVDRLARAATCSRVLNEKYKREI